MDILIINPAGEADPAGMSHCISEISIVQIKKFGAFVQTNIYMNAPTIIYGFTV